MALLDMKAPSKPFTPPSSLPLMPPTSGGATSTDDCKNPVVYKSKCTIGNIQVAVDQCFTENYHCNLVALQGIQLKNGHITTMTLSAYGMKKTKNLIK